MEEEIIKINEVLQLAIEGGQVLFDTKYNKDLIGTGERMIDLASYEIKLSNNLMIDISFEDGGLSAFIITYDDRGVKTDLEKIAQSSSNKT